MKAIYGKKLYAINRMFKNGVELKNLDIPTHHEILFISLKDPELNLKPTELELQELSE